MGSQAGEGFDCGSADEVVLMGCCYCAIWGFDFDYLLSPDAGINAVLGSGVGKHSEGVGLLSVDSNLCAESVTGLCHEGITGRVEQIGEEIILHVPR